MKKIVTIEDLIKSLENGETVSSEQVNVSSLKAELKFFSHLTKSAYEESRTVMKVADKKRKKTPHLFAISGKKQAR